MSIQSFFASGDEAAEYLDSAAHLNMAFCALLSEQGRKVGITTGKEIKADPETLALFGSLSHDEMRRISDVGMLLFQPAVKAAAVRLASAANVDAEWWRPAATDPYSLFNAEYMRFLHSQFLAEPSSMSVVADASALLLQSLSSIETMSISAVAKALPPMMMPRYRPEAIAMLLGDDVSKSDRRVYLLTLDDRFKYKGLSEGDYATSRPPMLKCQRYSEDFLRAQRMAEVNAKLSEIDAHCPSLKNKECRQIRNEVTGTPATSGANYNSLAPFAKNVRLRKVATQYVAIYSAIAKHQPTREMVDAALDAYELLLFFHDDPMVVAHLPFDRALMIIKSLVQTQDLEHVYCEECGTAYLKPKTECERTRGDWCPNKALHGKQIDERITPAPKRDEDEPFDLSPSRLTRRADIDLEASWIGGDI